MHAKLHIHIYLHMFTYTTAHTHKYLHTFILTQILTPWSKLLLEKLTGSQLVKKFRVFYGSESSLPLYKSL
jgi:hypothetical protein